MKAQTLKRIFIILTLVLSSFMLLPFKSWAQPDGWNLASDANGVKVWLLKSNSDISGSLQIKKPNKNLEWAKVNGEEISKKFEEQKIKMLAFVGISSWTVEERKWNPKKDVYELQIKGHYLNPKKQKINFIELHLYTNDRTVQFLFTAPSNTVGQEKFSNDIFTYMKTIAEHK